MKYLWRKIDDKTVMAGCLRHPKVAFDLNLKVRRFDLLPTQRGLFVSHWTGDVGAELEGSPLPENLALRLVVLSLH